MLAGIKCYSPPFQWHGYHDARIDQAVTRHVVALVMTTL